LIVCDLVILSVAILCPVIQTTYTKNTTMHKREKTTGMKCDNVLRWL